MICSLGSLQSMVLHVLDASALLLWQDERLVHASTMHNLKKEYALMMQ